MASEGKVHLILAAGLVVAVVAGFVLGRREPAPDETPAATETTPTPDLAPPPPSNPDFAAAAEALQKQDLPHARDLLERVPPGDPDYASARHNLGVIYAVIGQAKRSEEIFQELVTSRPDDAEAWIGLGWARYMAGEWATAETATLRALETDPRNATARYNLALFRVALGQVPSAIEAYRRALELDGDRSVLASAVRDLIGYSTVHQENLDARYALAFLHFAAGDPVSEIKQLELFLAASPSDELREKAERRLPLARSQANAQGLLATPSATPAPTPTGP